jgi:hypothetical protein
LQRWKFQLDVEESGQSRAIDHGTSEVVGQRR